MSQSGGGLPPGLPPFMSHPLLVPPRAGERTARKQTVLDEETYTRGLSRIIERDFFPDLPRLRAHNAYVHALEEGDVDTIEACAHALVEAEAGDAEPSSMSISEYQARYTTEDNASFAQLLETDAQRRQAKYGWAASTPSATSRRIEAPKRAAALPPAPPKRAMMPPPDVPRVRYAKTRLVSLQDPAPSAPSTPSSSVVDDAIQASSTPQIGGYRFVRATPREVREPSTPTSRRWHDLSPAARTLLQRTSRGGGSLYRSTPSTPRWTPTPSPVSRRD